MKDQEIQKVIKSVSTPVFIYEEGVLRSNFGRIWKSASKYSMDKRLKLFVSYFCNSNPNLFNLFDDSRVGVLLQTSEELSHLKEFGISDKEIIVSPSALADNEIDFWVENKIMVNLSSLEEVKYFLTKHSGASFGLRLDVTFWGSQRTGIKRYQLKELVKLLGDKKIIPHSIHIYAGTGSSLKEMKKSVNKTLQIYSRFFSKVPVINLGGGFRFDYSKWEAEEKHFDWDGYFSYLKERIKAWKIPDGVTFVLEPGRDIFVDSGQLFIKVKRVVKLKNYQNIATDGSYVYIPSANKNLRRHNLRFFNQDLEEYKDKGPKVEAFLNGSTTLSSDYVIPGKFKVPTDLKEGDYVSVLDAGAYAATQHLEFLNKKPCPEVLVKEDGSIFLITKRGEDDDKIRNILKVPEKI
jgi:diaminopimelate decarboxylase